ncbi:MAG: L-histidine N(alpha)-methyltransferase [Polyangia bacterium]
MKRPKLDELRDLLADAAEHETPAAVPLIEAAAELLDLARQVQEGEMAQVGEVLARAAPEAVGLLLRQRRKAAKLSVRQLAQRAGLSKGTVFNVETGRTAPSPQTLAALARVREMRLAETAGPRERPDCWLPQGYDPLALLMDLRGALNSPGGFLEQTCLYLDHASALDWLAICSAPAYVEANRALPLQPMAQALMAEACRGLDLVALGPGDGQVEIALCKELCAASASPDVHLFLIDISHTLLTVAHRRAREELAPLGVQVESIHGDFHQLGRYHVLNRRTGSPRRSCYVLLGNTLANLDHEARFVRDVLSSANTGDFMLLDFSLVYADAEDAEAVRRAEPVLNRPLSPSFERWLGGLVQRYSSEVDSFTLGTDVLTECAIPGSYEIGYFADVQLRDGQSRRHYLARARRYDRGKLLAAFARHGWHEAQVLPCGQGARAVLALLRRA